MKNKAFKRAGVLLSVFACASLLITVSTISVFSRTNMSDNLKSNNQSESNTDAELKYNKIIEKHGETLKQFNKEHGTTFEIAQIDKYTANVSDLIAEYDMILSMDNDEFRGYLNKLYDGTSNSKEAKNDYHIDNMPYYKPSDDYLSEIVPPSNEDEFDNHYNLLGK